MRWAFRLTALVWAMACAPVEPARAPAPRFRSSAHASTFETPKPPAQYRRVRSSQRRDWSDAAEPQFLLLSGQRLLEKDGSYETADSTGAAPLISGLRLPGFAGGGFVFWSREGLYRSSSFLGRLKPLAATGFTPHGVALGPGFLLVSSNDGQRVVLDTRTGAPRPPSPAGLVDIAYSNSDGRVVAALELGRAAISLDRGSTFREVHSELDGIITGLSREPLGFIVDSNALLSLTPEGRFVRAVLPTPSEPKDPRWPLAESPLEHAVTRGVLRAPGRALVAAFAAVAEVDVQSGELTRVGPQLLPGNPVCQLLEQGDELLMQCQARDALTFVSQPDSPRPVVERSFNGKPEVQSAFGQLLVEASCDGSASPLAVCLRSSDGAWKPLAPPPPPAPASGAPPAPASGAPETAVGYALKADGGVIAFVAGPQRKGYVDLKSGHFSALSGEQERISDARSTCLVDAGATLRCLTRDGPLSFDAQGKPEPRALRFNWLGSYQQRALGLDDEQQLFQSEDFGRTWTEVAPPLAMDRGPDSTSRCSSVGCKLGSWLRLSWEARPPVRPRQAEPVALPKPSAPRRPILSCSRLREASLATSPALAQTGATRLREPGFGSEVVPASHFRMPLLASAPHQSSGDVLGLRGIVSGLLEAGGDGSVVSARPLALRFVDYFDAKGRKQSASITLSELVRAARSVGNPPPDLSFEDQLSLQPVPVLARESGKSAGFVLNHEGIYLWVRAGRATPLPLDVSEGTWLVLSALAEPDGGLSLLADDAELVRHAIRVNSGVLSERFELPANVAVGVESATPDALGLAPDGEVAVLRFTSGLAAPSQDYPVLAYRPGKVEALAPWSSLRAAADPACADKSGYRALVMPTESWLELSGTLDDASDQDWGMIAAVRWSSQRVCLEAVELADATFSVADEDLLTRVVASFEDKPEAARLGFAQGLELRQPLSCSLLR